MTTIRVFQITSDKIDSFTRNFGRPRDCLSTHSSYSDSLTLFKQSILEFSMETLGFILTPYKMYHTSILYWNSNNNDYTIVKQNTKYFEWTIITN